MFNLRGPQSAFALLIILGAVFYFYLSSGVRGDPAHLKALVQSGALLVDVRTPGEYAKDHISGAVNIPLDQVETRLDEFGVHDRQIVVYCVSGRRSASAQSILKTRGFDQVHNLGGRSAWPADP